MSDTGLKPANHPLKSGDEVTNRAEGLTNDDCSPDERSSAS